MAQTANTSAGSARQAALARRRAMSSKGKAALQSNSAMRTSRSTPGRDVQSGASIASGTGAGARDAARARRRAMAAQGKAGIKTDRQRQETRSGKAPDPDNRPERECSCGCKKEKNKDKPHVQSNTSNLDTASGALGAGAAGLVIQVKGKMMASPARAASVARRRAQSARGKAGLRGGGMSAAQTARAANPGVSGRELAKALRAERSQRGRCGEKASEPVGRRRQRRDKQSTTAYWKVGVSETTHGQQVTGTLVGRSRKITGDEPSTCRVITGTEYLGADIFRDLCQSEPTPTPLKVRVTTTSRGRTVTGTEVGRGPKVTGNEPGTCKRITGVEYLSNEQLQSFCGVRPEPGPPPVSIASTAKGKTVTGDLPGRSPKVTGNEPGAERDLTGTQYTERGNGAYPDKVGLTQTTRGAQITGTLVGRSERVTGDEPGGCQIVTGDDYVGAEQYRDLCGVDPQPQDAKVGVSSTLKGKPVTGTMTSHSPKITGDEPGLCKAVTGTPYAGADQYAEFCAPEQAQGAVARVPQRIGTPAPALTGTQPGINGKMTGAERGACEPVTGTPYVGTDQFAQACPTAPAEPGSPDFPQTFTEVPWGRFSIMPPAHAAAAHSDPHGVTGTRYEGGQITGPFGKAEGKVTGTEEFRFGRTAAESLSPQPAPVVEGRVKSRVSGEGMDAGPKITGDDWDRGDRVTGTEGLSAMRRNPTLRGERVGSNSAMPPPKRNEDVAEPVSKVTGGTGPNEQGALVTYSGGARG